MAQAAAQLVQVEQSIESEAAADVPEGLENSREEAAATLERKMATMEAVLAARRARGAVPEAPPPEPTEPTSQLDVMRQQLEPPAHVSTGPAAGTGNELILQVRTRPVRALALRRLIAWSACFMVRRAGSCGRTRAGL